MITKDSRVEYGVVMVCFSGKKKDDTQIFIIYNTCNNTYTYYTYT